MQFPHLPTGNATHVLGSSIVLLPGRCMCGGCFLASCTVSLHLSIVFAILIVLYFASVDRNLSLHAGPLLSVQYKLTITLMINHVKHVRRKTNAHPGARIRVLHATNQNMQRLSDRFCQGQPQSNKKHTRSPSDSTKQRISAAG